MAVLPVTEEEFKKLRLHDGGKKHPVSSLLEAMQIGEMFSIFRSDFTWKKRTPRVFINRLEKRTKKRFRMWTMHGRGGWVVKRLEDEQ